jgi:hypothetical protein
MIADMLECRANREWQLKLVRPRRPSAETLWKHIGVGSWIAAQIGWDGGKFRRSPELKGVIADASSLFRIKQSLAYKCFSEFRKYQEANQLDAVQTYLNKGIVGTDAIAVATGISESIVDYLNRLLTECA